MCLCVSLLLFSLPFISRIGLCLSRCILCMEFTELHTWTEQNQIEQKNTRPLSEIFNFACEISQWRTNREKKQKNYPPHIGTVSTAINIHVSHIRNLQWNNFHFYYCSFCCCCCTFVLELNFFNMHSFFPALSFSGFRRTVLNRYLPPSIESSPSTSSLSFFTASLFVCKKESVFIFIV